MVVHTCNLCYSGGRDRSNEVPAHPREKPKTKLNSKELEVWLK
jgi:hypothetical protein